MMILSGNFIVN